MKKSSRFRFAIASMFLGFLTIWFVLLFPPAEAVAEQVMQSMGWVLTTVAGGYLTTKIAEHGTKFLRKPDGLQSHTD